MRSFGTGTDVLVPRHARIFRTVVLDRWTQSYSQLGESEPRTLHRTRLVCVLLGLLAAVAATVLVRNAAAAGSGLTSLSSSGTSKVQQQSEQNQLNGSASSHHLRASSVGPEERPSSSADLDSAPAPAPQSTWHFVTDAAGSLQTVFGQAALNLHLISSTSTTMTGTTTTSTSTATTTRTSTSSTTTSVTTTTRTTTTTKLATLFCFMVVRTVGYEPGLATQQYWKRASIFECEESAVYSNGGVVQIGDFMSTEVKADSVKMGNLSKAGTTTSSWLNTLIFMKTWELVLADGRWWQHDWTVKVDPDAVFFPWRLKFKLYPYYTAGDFNGPALFVGNCDRSWHGGPPKLKLFGSLEVFSRNALGMYKAHGEQCKQNLDWKGWGEDFFMQNCMEMLKVGKVNGVSFLGDARCYYAPCTDASKVAFHDFKDVGSYFACWGQSKAAEGEMLMK
mmetsp:Transcript_24189/g.64396  ORF Transcript_24189/g.64396 Transcript_24189/m.64396 type:complete len:449 (-) Transcript_24189:102-1448(-)